MSLIPFMKTSLMIVAVSLILGCASRAPQETGQVPGESAYLAPGDTILVSVITRQGTRQDEAPAYLKLPPVKILEDGTISIDGLKVAGLTPEAAAARIRVAFIKNRYGFASQIVEVKVVKLQPTAQPNAVPPHR
jgi:protein involved in polysaccharide export with SLBB domain